jgi:DNA-binding NtrC family response regulator
MKAEDIIVVEDNSAMRVGISESLKRDGYLVSTFENGPKALETFKNNPSSIAIIDLKMEPLDGIEILKRMKEIQPAIEVLMISAYGTVETAVKAMQLGANDFLTKPFSPDE